ncbi:glycosyltransferase family 4 protein [Candidatus Roizmanbacteria bacterium]|nr:glycosyltransferase family 4 protein [Candidatus Roizmanbacteria bacterium]
MNKIKSRILFLVQLPPPVHGVCVINKTIVYSKLVNARFEVSIFRLGFSNTFNQMHSDQLRKAILTLFYIFRLILKIATFRPKFAYFTISPTGAAFFRDAIFAFIFKWLKIPIVYHLHGTGVSSRLKSRLVSKIYRTVFNGEFVFHLSPLLYDDIKEIVSYKNCRFIPNGVSLLAKKHSETDNVRPEDNSLVRILYFANLDPRKGVFDLVDAFCMLLLQGVRAELTIGGSYTTQLSESQLEIYLLKSRKLGGQINVLGPVYGQDKAKMYQEADIFVYPSCHDAFPLVVLEAMSYGLPIVTTKEGAIPDMVEDGCNGLLVPHRDPESLSVAVAKLISDRELRKQFGEISYQRYKTKFTSDIFEKNFVDKLTEVSLLLEKDKADECCS